MSVGTVVGRVIAAIGKSFSAERRGLSGVNPGKNSKSHRATVHIREVLARATVLVLEQGRALVHIMAKEDTARVKRI